MSTNFTNVRGDAYDVVVVGGGNGGYAAALRAAALDLSVALVEADRLGGTCLNRGCIPTKALLETGHVAEQIREAGRVGLRAAFEAVDWPAVKAFKDDVVGRMHRGLGGLVRSRGIELLRGDGVLTAPGLVEVRSEGDVTTLVAERGIVMAPGCVPRRPAGLRVDGVRVLTSDEALDGPLPDSVIVIGGNYIGIEFATLYRALGARVVLAEQLDRVAPHEDADISRALERALVQRGIEVRTATTVAGVEATDGEVALTLVDAGGERVERTELALVAVGRQPRADEAGLAAAGVELQDGFVLVDDEYRTSIPSVLAVGDAIRIRGEVAPHPQLAHVALAEGIRAAEAIAGLTPAPIDYDAIPHVIYGVPEVAAVGLTEQAAREAGHDVRTATYDLSHNARALMFGATGFLKTVTDAAGTILGVHVIGPHASEVLAAGSMATAWSARAEEVAALVHAHPTVGEAFGETALALAGAPLHVASAPKVPAALA
jgi:dihydrolipoamide dehydrogenase